MTETEARLNSHEAVCALRYDQINARLKRLEGLVIKTCAVLLIAMAGLIYKDLKGAQAEPQIKYVVPPTQQHP